MSCRRVCACPLQRPRACDSAPGSQPSREASQPQNSSPEASESSRWRTVTPADLLQVRPPARRVERRRDALAPRRRAQPREVDDVGVARRGRRRASSAASTSGSSWESISTIWASRRSASIASGCPCGDHTIVARSRDHQRVDDRVELGQVALADQQLHALAPDRDRARRAGRPRCRSARSPPAAGGPARPRRRPAATGGSARRAGAGSRSRRGSPCRRSRPCSSRAPARTRAPPCGAAANMLRSAASIRARASCRPRARRRPSRALASGAARSARRRPSGPPEPDAYVCSGSSSAAHAFRIGSMIDHWAITSSVRVNSVASPRIASRISRS